MNYWLLKTEPSTFSIDDLIKSKTQTTQWEGVRNYQARNFICQMNVGDFAFFYHSNSAKIGIVGYVKIIKAAYPDLTAQDPNSAYYDPKSSIDNPRWYVVDVQFCEKFPKMITLASLKNNPALSEMAVVRRGNRLSVTPVTITEWSSIMNDRLLLL